MKTSWRRRKRDRVDTTMQVWMGLTLGCAKCHNHKFDPFSQAEYYQFFAIFNQTSDNDQPNELPTMTFSPTAATGAPRHQEIDARVAELKKQLDTPTPQLAIEQEEWEAPLRIEPSWAVLEPAELKSESGTTLRQLDDGSILAEGASPDNDVYTIAARTDLSGLTALRLEALADPSLPQGGSGRSAAMGNFVLCHQIAARSKTRELSAPAVGRFVRIELPGEGKILSLAEVQVFQGTENVARTGKATQSSTDFGGAPERAMDGNTSGDFSANSTTHTKQEKNPWWEVDLGDEKPIERVSLWNRTDNALGSRLAKFKVLVLDKDRKTAWSQEVAAAPSPSSELATSSKITIPLAQSAADFSQNDFGPSQALECSRKRT